MQSTQKIRLAMLSLEIYNSGIQASTEARLSDILVLK
jgi:hypothetical protein